MIGEGSEQVAQRVQLAVDAGSVIDYRLGFPDKQYPEITWSTFGLPVTNEIAVIATVGDLRLGIAHESRLVCPVMADRIHGIDVDDRNLSLWLSAKLWNTRSYRLIAEALQVRGGT